MPRYIFTDHGRALFDCYGATLDDAGRAFVNDRRRACLERHPGKPITLAMAFGDISADGFRIECIPDAVHEADGQGKLL